MTDRLLTAREVAELLGLSPASVLRRWRAGELPGYRLASNVLRFSERDITAWLEERRSGPSLPSSMPYGTLSRMSYSTDSREGNRER